MTDPCDKPPRSRMPRERRTEFLLDAAEDLFADRGLASTSIEDIARASGVTRPLVYDLLGDKNAIVVRLAARARARFNQDLLEVVAVQSTVHDAFLAGATLYFDLFQRDRHRWELLLMYNGMVGSHTQRELLDLKKSTTVKIAWLVMQVVPTLDLRTASMMAYAFFGAAEQFCYWWREYPETALDDVVTSYVGLCEATSASLVGAADVGSLPVRVALELAGEL